MKKLFVAVILLSVASILSFPSLGIAGALEDILERQAQQENSGICL